MIFDLGAHKLRRSKREVVVRSALFALALFFVAALVGCEGAFNETVLIPDVDVQCSSTNCANATGPKSLYVYLTKSGCQSPFFGNYITGTGSVSCNGLNCTGSVAQWSENSTVVSKMRSGVWDICAVIALEAPDVPDDPSYNKSGNAKHMGSAVFNDQLKQVQILNWLDI